MADDDLPLVLRAIADLRREVREDINLLTVEIEHVEERLMRNMTGLAKTYSDDLALNEREHVTFRSFIRAAELAQARRDGAMGVFRFGVELLSKHAKPLIGIVVSVTAAAAVLLGHISIVFGS